MPRTLKKPTAKKKPKKKPAQAKPKAMEVEATPAVPAVWRPGVDPVGEDEQLEYDLTAYDCYHGLSLEWPSLSFDICKDDLGAPRSTFPHTMFMVAGSQAQTAKQNSLMVVKLTNLGQGRHGKKAKEGEDEDEDLSESDSDSDDDDGEEPPRLHYRSIEHRGGINRVRCMPQRPGMVAVWGDTGQVKIYDVERQLRELAEETEARKGSSARAQVNPIGSHSHSSEGFALDWSPLKPGLLVSGDCRSKMHVWTPQEGGKWQVGGSFQGHTASVEDLQWSPTEETVFASCSVDGTIRIWDTRERSKSMVAVKAHDTDVNVVSWNKLVTYMLASGDDDGLLRIWDLRSFSDGSHVSQFKYHAKAITAVEWSPYESSMLVTSSADNTVAVWDLALERDPEEEAALVPEGAAEAPSDLPAQLLFVHAGQSDPKEAHFHPQIPGLLVSTAADGFNVFKPSNL